MSKLYRFIFNQFVKERRIGKRPHLLADEKIGLSKTVTRKRHKG